MPVQQITVVPARESSHGKGAPYSKDSAEGSKTPGRSGSRSSNISKASNSGLTTATRVSISPSSQDICSPGHLARLEEDAETRKPNKHAHTHPPVAVSARGPSAPKKQVKRRHRRERSSFPSDATAAVTAAAAPKRERAERSDRSLSSDRSEHGEKRERASRNRRELPPRLRCAAAPQTDSTSEEEARREARSWSKEKARRVRRRSGSSRERERDGTGPARAEEERTEVMVLQSVESDEGNGNLPTLEDTGGLKRRHNSQASAARDAPASHGGNKSCKSPSPEDSSSPVEDSEELITRYQEKGPGGGDMSAPTPQKACGMNGSAAAPYSDDSETEVCRICHCEGDDDCPLITPCRCTGSLSFVHQGCLNQWIKSSDTRCCELCKFDFVMETKLKPLRKWEKLHMTKGERRKIFCSVFFHLLAIVCMLWSVYVLAKRTAEEIRLGKNEEFWRVSLLKYHTPNGVLEWPFWTKLIVVAIGFTGGLIFMYIQCKVYLQLWRRLKAFNRIITVQNCPEKGLHNAQARSSAATIGRHEAMEVPVSPAPAPGMQADSETSAGGTPAPVRNPV